MSKITRRAHWNEDSESWTVEDVDLSGNSVKALKRLVASNSQPGHPANSTSHLHNENLLNLDLDLPQRTIYEYDGEGHQFDIQVRLCIQHLLAHYREKLGIVMMEKEKKMRI